MFPPDVNPKKNTVTGSLKLKSVVLKKPRKQIKSLKHHIYKKSHLLQLRTLTITLKQNTLATDFSVHTVLKTLKQLMDATDIN